MHIESASQSRQESMLKLLLKIRPTNAQPISVFLPGILTHAVIVLNNVASDTGEGRPLAGGRLVGGAPLVTLELAHFTAQPVGGHTCGRGGNPNLKRRANATNTKEII